MLLSATIGKIVFGSLRIDNKWCGPTVHLRIIRGHRAIAEAYAAHCLDVYDHYAWRYWLQRDKENAKERNGRRVARSDSVARSVCYARRLHLIARTSVGEGVVKIRDGGDEIQADESESAVVVF